MKSAKRSIFLSYLFKSLHFKLNDSYVFTGGLWCERAGGTLMKINGQHILLRQRLLHQIHNINQKEETT